MRAVALTLFAALLLGSLFALDARLARSQEGEGVEVTVRPLGPSPLVVTIVAPLSVTEVTQGTKFRVTVEVKNTGTEQLRQGEVTLSVPGGLSIGGKPTRKFGPLNGEQIRKVQWKMRVDRDADPGSYVLTVEATATLGRDSPEVSGEDSVTVEVAALNPAAVLGVRIRGVDPAGDIPRGSRFRISAEVTNLGGVPLPLGAVTLHVDESGLSVDGDDDRDDDRDETRRFGMLAPGESAQLHWDVGAVEPGLYAVIVEATTTLGLDGPPITVAAPALLVTVVEPALDALAVEIVAIESRGDIPLGTRFSVTVAVTNTGAAPLHDGELVLLLDGDALSIEGPDEHGFGTLRPGDTEQRRWDVLATEAGLFAVGAEATAEIGREGPEIRGVAPEQLVTVVAPELAVLRVEIEGIAPAGDIEQGTQLEVTARVINTGPDPLRAVDVRLFVPAGLGIIATCSRP